MSKDQSLIGRERSAFHSALLGGVLSSHNGVPSIADKDSRASVAIAQEIVKLLGQETLGIKIAGQTAGRKFEEVCSNFIASTFLHLQNLRPGKWQIGGATAISKFEQFSHLASLQEIAGRNSEVAVALGNDYLIKPDIVISRSAETDECINSKQAVVGDKNGNLTPLRFKNNHAPILHASISCKWTLRSDRAQNARSEGLNLVKNRKGHLPHIAVITAEPTPSRIASIALGTGEIDCVYHFALNELRAALDVLNFDDAREMLKIMIDGKRLRDISDLPFDLAT